MTQHRAASVVLAASLAAVLCAACGSGGHRGALGASSRSTSTSVAPSTSTTAAPVTTTSTAVPPTVHVATTLRRAPSPAPTAATTPAPLMVERVRGGVGAAQQVITVTSSSYSSTTATLQAFEKDGGAWHSVLGPVTAFVGVHGFSSDKHEGDGTTPTGTYPFTLMFGTGTDPGVHFQYRQAGPDDVWVDDSNSSLYNTWQEAPANGRWASAEQLDQPGPYHEAAVIGYNTARVPGKGSAIFMHVSLGRPTAGCVSVSEPLLLDLLRWLDPARQPVIVMGPLSAVTG